ncbi:MAG TPA: copper resistance protein CopC, partial [Candidatus Limnocylindria bacterium]|nr:copper resistance protein CopC [Candidatus Limnocylindria bacterium]
MTARAARLAAVAALLALLVAPAVPGGAGGRVLAHAQLVASSPAAGAVLPESPDELRLVFSEPLEAGLSSLDVYGRDGKPLIDHGGEIDPADPYALVVTNPDLPDGVFSLTWRSLSSADGHSAEGFFTFGIGNVVVEGATSGGAGHVDADPLTLVGRWLTYLGLLLALGIAVFHWLVIRDGTMPMRLARLLAVGLAVSAVATLVSAALSGLETDSVGEYLFGSRNGMLQLARAGVAAAGALALPFVPSRASGAVAAAAGLIGIALLVAAGHASASPGVAPILAQVAHVAAAAVWIGGLTGLLALQFRPALVIRGRAPSMRSVVPRFSAVALVAIGMVSATGVYAAWLQTGTLLPIDTDYGRTLIIKSAIALAAFSLGGLNYFDGGRMRAWLAAFPTRTSIEVVAAVAVLAVTAVLATTPPGAARGVAIKPIPDAFGEVAPGMGLEIVPGRPGVNRVVVTTTDALAAGSSVLELAVDRLDTGTSTRIPLTHDMASMSGMEGMEGMPGMEGMDHGGGTADDGSVEWTADAVVLPAGSQWDTSVRVV